MKHGSCVHEMPANAPCTAVQVELHLLCLPEPQLPSAVCRACAWSSQSPGNFRSGACPRPRAAWQQRPLQAPLRSPSRSNCFAALCSFHCSHAAVLQRLMHTCMHAGAEIMILHNSCSAALVQALHPQHSLSGRHAQTGPAAGAAKSTCTLAHSCGRLENRAA